MCYSRFFRAFILSASLMAASCHGKEKIVSADKNSFFLKLIANDPILHNLRMGPCGLSAAVLMNTEQAFSQLKVNFSPDLDYKNPYLKCIEDRKRNEENALMPEAYTSIAMTSEQNSETPFCYFLPPNGWEIAEPRTLGPQVKMAFVKKIKKEGFSPSLNLAIEEVDGILMNISTMLKVSTNRTEKTSGGNWENCTRHLAKRN
jgi:hypothetical protein